MARGLAKPPAGGYSLVIPPSYNTWVGACALSASCIHLAVFWSVSTRTCKRATASRPPFVTCNRRAALLNCQHVCGQIYICRTYTGNEPHSACSRHVAQNRANDLSTFSPRLAVRPAGGNLTSHKRTYTSEATAMRRQHFVGVPWTHVHVLAKGDCDVSLAPCVDTCASSVTHVTHGTSLV